MVWQLLLGIWMSGVSGAVFLLPMPGEGFRDAEGYRAVFFHVPTAITASLAFLVATYQAAAYLIRRDFRADDHSVAAAELGLLFAFLATVTGSIFSGTQWGLYWNWDPRQTAIVILMLLYGAYLALRSAVEEEEVRARLAAAYAVFAFFPMLFLIFLTRPEVMKLLERVGLSLQTLHPQQAPLETFQKLVLMAAMVGFFGLYAWLHRLRAATLGLHRRLKGGGDHAR